MNNLFTLECPFCGKHGSDILISEFLLGMGSCYCPSCNMQGPIASTEEKAVSYWNDMPRRLLWTSDIPKIHGYYFIREKNSRDNQIFYFSNRGYFLNGDIKIDQNDLIDFEFLGPITSYNAIKTKENS